MQIIGKRTDTNGTKYITVAHENGRTVEYYAVRYRGRHGGWVSEDGYDTSAAFDRELSKLFKAAA